MLRWVSLLMLLVFSLGLSWTYAWATDWSTAVDLYKRGKYIEAAMEAKAWLEQNKQDWAEGLTFLGQCYLKAGKYNEALVEFDKAIRADAEQAKPYLYIGEIYSAQKKYSEAVKHFQKAEQKADTPEERKYLPLIYEEAGDAAMALKSIEEAAAFYQKATQLNSKRDTLWYKLGVAYYTGHDFDNALQAFENAYNSAPKNKNYGLYYLKTLTYVKKYDKATAIADHLVKLYPNEDVIIEASANAYLGAKIYPKAIQFYTTHLQNNPRDGWGYYNLGQAYVGAKQYEKAIEPLKKASELLNNYRVNDLLGFTYVKLKKYEDAKVQYQKAYDISKKPEYFEEIKNIQKRIEQEELKRKGLAEEIKDDGTSQPLR